MADNIKTSLIHNNKPKDVPKVNASNSNQVFKQPAAAAAACCIAVVPTLSSKPKINVPAESSDSEIDFDAFSKNKKKNGSERPSISSINSIFISETESNTNSEKG